MFIKYAITWCIKPGPKVNIFSVFIIFENSFIVISKNLKKCAYCSFLNPKGVGRCIKCGKKINCINSKYGLCKKCSNKMEENEFIKKDIVLNKIYG